jgi:prepilin-type N-terminal cleavage/methylation domain-containing protein
LRFGIFVKAQRAFTIVELLVVIAIIGLMASAVLAILSGVQKDARDKKRVEDLTQLERALELYYTDHQYYPKESAGANGDVSTNTTFITMIQSHLQGTPRDPTGLANPTFYYYYDGKAQCGNLYYAVVFARQMDKPGNANYATFLAEACNGVLDGEGRGGGTESYTIRLGESGG